MGPSGKCGLIDFHIFKRHADISVAELIKTRSHGVIFEIHIDQRDPVFEKAFFALIQKIPIGDTFILRVAFGGLVLWQGRKPEKFYMSDMVF